MRPVKTHLANANNIQNIAATHGEKVAQIAHTVTAHTQYGYKMQLSITGDVTSAGDHLNHSNASADLLLMDLPNAFDTVDRTLIWTAPYKKCPPIDTILYQTRGENTSIMGKRKIAYGAPQEDNVWVFRRSDSGALLCNIFRGDMINDFMALNDKGGIRNRLTAERGSNYINALVEGNTNSYEPQTKRKISD